MEKGNISYFLSVRVIPIRMALIQKNTNKKCCKDTKEKGILMYCWLECNADTVLTNYEDFLQNQK